MSNGKLKEILLSAISVTFRKGDPKDGYNTDYVLCTLNDMSEIKLLMKDIAHLKLDWTRVLKH